MTTTETVEPQVVPPPAPAPKQNVFQRIAGVLFAPADTFEGIARRPDIVGPLLIILAISFISTFVIMPMMDFEAVMAQSAEQIRKQNPQISEAELDRFSRISIATAKVIAWLSPLMMLVWQVVVASILLLAVRLMGGDGNFMQSFSTTLYSWMPLTLYSIVFTIVAALRGSFDPTTAATVVKSNPAFLTDMETNPVLFSMLSSLDVFTIWTIVLLVFGFSAVSKLSRVKTAIIVVTLWVAMLIVKLGFAALGAAQRA